MNRAKRQLREAVIDAAVRGLSIAEAAEELGVAYSTVHSTAWRARKAGLMPVYLRSARGGRPRRENAGATIAEVKQAVIHMARAGASEAEIAEELGLSEARVGVLLRQRRLRLALRRERRRLVITSSELAAACGTTKAVVLNHEHGITVCHLERFLRALADMREDRLRWIADELSDRGNPVPHVLDVQGPEDMDDALDKVRALTRAASVELSDREAEALRIWTHADTLEETGERMGVTRERARQLVYKALRRIRGDEGPPTQGGWPKPAPEPPTPRIVYAFGPGRRLTPLAITPR